MSRPRRSRIGIEMDYLPAGDFGRLQALCRGAAFVPCEADSRAASPDQDSRTRSRCCGRLSRIADQAITDALGAVKAGDSEMDIAGHLTRNVYALGAEHFKLMIVATGERSQLPNVGPSERRLQPEDVCRVEIFSVDRRLPGGRVPHRRRAAAAPPQAEAIWQHLRRMQIPDRLEMIKPGASCRAIYDAFIAKLRS